MPIYTRTGDKGKTSLFSGIRVWKNDSRVETYGTVDELNSILGVAVAHLSSNKKEVAYLKKILLSIQSDLFYIGAYLADLPDTIEDIDLPKRVGEFEHHIDQMMKTQSRVPNFVLPGGGKVASFLHLARTVARRAERSLIRLTIKTASAKGFGGSRENIDVRILKYINRLSDLLYAAARYANYIEKKKEIIWER